MTLIWAWLLLLLLAAVAGTWLYLCAAADGWRRGWDARDRGEPRQAPPWHDPFRAGRPASEPGDDGAGPPAPRHGMVYPYGGD